MKPWMRLLLPALTILSSNSGVSARDAAPKVLTPEQAVQAQAGSTVTVSFRVGQAYGIWASVPAGQEPSFGLKPDSFHDGKLRFSVLISGQLVKDLKRFGVEPMKPAPFFNGREIEVTGPVRKHEPQPGVEGAKPSYQIVVSRLEDFRLVK